MTTYDIQTTDELSRRPAWDGLAQELQKRVRDLMDENDRLRTTAAIANKIYQRENEEVLALRRKVKRLTREIGAILSDERPPIPGNL